MQEGGQTGQSIEINDISDFDCPNNGIVKKAVVATNNISRKLNAKYKFALNFETQLSQISEVEVDYSEQTINSPEIKPSKKIAMDTTIKSRFFKPEFDENADYQMESIGHSEKTIATSIAYSEKTIATSIENKRKHGSIH